MAAKKKNPAAMEFIVDQLKKNPKAPYAEIAEGAKRRGLKIFPIMYGRAQTLLGIVKMAPRGSKKKAIAAPIGAAGVVRRGPGRPRLSDTNPLDAVRGLVDSVRETERANEQLRHILERIRELIDSAV